MLAAAAISAGCVYSIPEPMLVREPRPEPIPIRIGVYWSPEFRSFIYRPHHLDGYALGKPSVRLLSDALALLFIEVVEVPRPGSGPSLRGDLAGTIEPRIVSAARVLFSAEPVEAGTIVQPVHITYGFTVYSPLGEPVASWEVTGRGNEPVGNPLDAFSTLKRNFHHAMREAAWRFTSGFRDVAEVRRWLDEQVVHKD